MEGSKSISTIHVYYGSGLRKTTVFPRTGRLFPSRDLAFKREPFIQGQAFNFYRKEWRQAFNWIKQK